MKNKAKKRSKAPIIGDMIFSLLTLPSAMGYIREYFTNPESPDLLSFLTGTFIVMGIARIFRAFRYRTQRILTGKIRNLVHVQKLGVRKGKAEGRHEFIQTVGLTRNPSFASQCVECGKCEQHCPQGISIRKKLKEADKELRPFHYKIAITAARAFMFRKTKTGKKK
jgi:ferredoxin